MSGAAAASGLLKGITVIDLSMFVAGPFASMVLADLGADVLKVEPLGGDPVRSNRIGPQIAGENAQFHSYNRNKRSLSLNLKDERGHAVLLDLARRADVVFDNFRPGVLERLKADHATLARVNPRIVSVSLSAFGQDGPWSLRPGYDLTVQALSGAMSLTGHPATGPAHIPMHLGDTAGGLYAAIAILAGVIDARREGRGRAIELSLLDSLVALLGDEVTNYLAEGVAPAQHEAGHPNLAPYQAFQAADAPLVVAAVGVEKFWTRLVEALGLPELAVDPRFADNGARAANRRALDAILAPVFATRPRAEWLELLGAADIPVAPVLTVPEALTSEHLRHRAMVAECTLPDGERAHVARSPIRVPGEVPPPASPGPRLGAHTRTVLADFLGYDHNRIEALVQEGVIA